MEQGKAMFSGIRCVFLDRDGVINRKAVEGKYISTWEEFQILPEVETAIAELNRRGQQVVVITNQRGIALGLYTAIAVDTIHNRLIHHLAPYGARIDAFYYCPHDRDQCMCRKPGTALLQLAIESVPDILPENCVMIGDSLSDIEAARAFGCRSIFVLGEPGTQKPGAIIAESLADAVADSLWDAVNRVLPD
jgi:D-glycero-D-manno-heptose 1,7-bisphosphate phosphatase